MDTTDETDHISTNYVSQIKYRVFYKLKTDKNFPLHTHAFRVHPSNKMETQNKDNRAEEIGTRIRTFSKETNKNGMN